MGKNTGSGFRHGAVRGRSQFQRSDGRYQKRDDQTGEFMSVKGSPGRFKGVTSEPDGRRSQDD